MTPIIFIHSGTSFYQKYTLHQSHHSNPSSEIFLVSDNEAIKYPFLKNMDIRRFFKTAKAFESRYKHLSPNPYAYELFCFQRWFILNELAKEYGFKKLLYLDSDIMLYENIFEHLERYEPFSFTISNKVSPHICFFPDTTVLDDFCRFLQDEMYIDTFFVDKINTKFRHFQQNSESEGVSDMVAFEYFREFKGYKALELTEIRENAVFDHNINVADGFVFDKTNKIKKIRIKNYRPYGVQKMTGDRLFFKSLHFQGINAKNFIPSFYFYKDLETDKKKDAIFFRRRRSEAAKEKVRNHLKKIIKKVSTLGMSPRKKH